MGTKTGAVLIIDINIVIRIFC